MAEQSHKLKVTGIVLLPWLLYQCLYGLPSSLRLSGDDNATLDTNNGEPQIEQFVRKNFDLVTVGRTNKHGKTLEYWYEWMDEIGYTQVTNQTLTLLHLDRQGYDDDLDEAMGVCNSDNLYSYPLFIHSTLESVWNHYSQGFKLYQWNSTEWAQLKGYTKDVVWIIPDSWANASDPCEDYSDPWMDTSRSNHHRTRFSPHFCGQQSWKGVNYDDLRNAIYKQTFYVFLSEEAIDRGMNDIGEDLNVSHIIRGLSKEQMVQREQRAWKKKQMYELDPTTYLIQRMLNETYQDQNNEGEIDIDQQQLQNQWMMYINSPENRNRSNNSYHYQIIDVPSVFYQFAMHRDLNDDRSRQDIQNDQLLDDLLKNHLYYHVFNDNQSQPEPYFYLPINIWVMTLEEFENEPYFQTADHLELMLDVDLDYFECQSPGHSFMERSGWDPGMTSRFNALLSHHQYRPAHLIAKHSNQAIITMLHHMNQGTWVPNVQTNQHNNHSLIPTIEDTLARGLAQGHHLFDINEALFELFRYQMERGHIQSIKDYQSAFDFLDFLQDRYNSVQDQERRRLKEEELIRLESEKRPLLKRDERWKSRIKRLLRTAEVLEKEEMMREEMEDLEESRHELGMDSEEMKRQLETISEETLQRMVKAHPENFQWMPKHSDNEGSELRTRQLLSTEVDSSGNVNDHQRGNGSIQNNNITIEMEDKRDGISLMDRIKKRFRLSDSKISEQSEASSNDMPFDLEGIGSPMPFSRLADEFGFDTEYLMDGWKQILYDTPHQDWKMKHPLYVGHIVSEHHKEQQSDDDRDEVSDITEQMDRRLQFGLPRNVLESLHDRSDLEHWEYPPKMEHLDMLQWHFLKQTDHSALQKFIDDQIRRYPRRQAFLEYLIECYISQSKQRDGKCHGLSAIEDHLPGYLNQSHSFGHHFDWSEISEWVFLEDNKDLGHTPGIHVRKKNQFHQQKYPDQRPVKLNSIIDKDEPSIFEQSLNRLTRVISMKNTRVNVAGIERSIAHTSSKNRRWIECTLLNFLESALQQKDPATFLRYTIFGDDELSSDPQCWDVIS